MEQWLLTLVERFGYLGIFFATLIESTFIPVPAEVTVVPAGILAAKGDLNYWGALGSAVTGVIAGSVINFYLGKKLGRAVILKYGKYIFLTQSFLERTEIFFRKHGAAAVFMGRLLPGVKHYIAFVAGIAGMPFRSFLAYTSLGGLIWMWIILQAGFMAGRNAEKGTISGFETALIIVAVITVIAFLVKEKLFKR